MNQCFFLEILDRPIAFHRLFAKVAGSVNGGVMLSQAFYWSKRTKDPNGWFYKTQDEWEEETTLTRREQETCRKNMREAGFWEEKLAGTPAQLYFRINFSALEAVLIYQSKINSLSMAESAKLDCTNPPNKDVANRQTSICTESTSEITFPELKNSGDELILEATPSMPVRKRGRPPKPTDPRHADAVAMWEELYKERFSQPYAFQPKDFKHLSNFLKTMPSTTVSEMRETLNSVWNYEVGKGEYVNNWHRIHTLSALVNRWSEIIAIIQEQK